MPFGPRPASDTPKRACRAATRRRSAGAFALIAAAGLALAFPALAAEPDASQPSPSPYSVAAKVDWRTRVLAVDVRLDMVRAGLRLPAGRLEAQRLIDRDFPGILESLVVDLPVDSYRSVGDCVADGSIDVGDLLGLADAARPRDSSFTKDLRGFRVSYDLSLETVAAIFVHHRTATVPPAPLEYRASRPFTGIVINAAAPLPVHGERVTGTVVPCLFPRLFDEGMALLLDRNGVDPAALAAWGEVGYAAALDPASLARVGDDPLRIDATAAFGTDRTDLIIPRDEALKILALPENRALLAAGKVMLIIDGSALTQTLGGSEGNARTDK